MGRGWGLSGKCDQEVCAWTLILDPNANKVNESKKFAEVINGPAGFAKKVTCKKCYP